MKTESNITYSTGGYWMLVGLVLLIGLPPVVGHFFMNAEAAPSVHADASAAKAAN